MNFMERTVLFSLAILAISSGCDRDKETKPNADSPDVSVQESVEEEPARDQPATGPARSLDELPDGVNAVQNEMRALNPAMHVILTAIANDQLERIPPAVKKVHPTRQVTMEAIEKGLYQPPQNADDMAGFKKLDDTFHEGLKTLLKASKEDDLQGATTAYKQLVQGCTDCHTRYRFAPTGP
jgi:hypothetical protein